MIIEIGVLGLFVLIEGYIIWNLTRKTEMLETWIEDFSDRMNEAYKDMHLIDAKGVFEADDEVGFFFDEVKQLGTQLEELFETEEVDDDTQEKKEK